MIRPTAAATFFILKVIKVFTFYFLINFENVSVKITFTDQALSMVLLGFIFSYLFTQQTKSAHHNQKFIHSVVCNKFINN